MASNAQIKAKVPDTEEERREMLNDLGAHYESLDEDDVKLHDFLATDVAADEHGKPDKTHKDKKGGDEI